MKATRICFWGGLLACLAMGLGAQTLNPTVSQVTSSSFTLTWTTSEPLNTQVHYGAGNLGTNLDNWTLSTSHTATVSGLQADTAYRVEAESSYYSNPDLVSPELTVTTASAGSGTASTTTASTGARLFPAAGANWLYSAPTGTGLNISSMTSKLAFTVNVHTGGFDYPVQDTDGTHGCTTFTDTLVYKLTDKICVPNPSGGYAPSVGGYGANDGHLVIVDTSTGYYYDFWKLSVNSAGQPTSTNVGGIVSGNLATSNGTPGNTAAEITGLAGDILPGELDCATCLNHALNVVVPGTMNSSQVGTQAPAEKTDGTVAGAVFREGAKIRMDPSVDLSTLGASVAAQAILRALQLYGGAITDQTGGDGISFYSALPTSPDLTGLNAVGSHLWVYY